MAIYRFCFRDGKDKLPKSEERNFAHDKQAIDNGAAICAGQDGDRVEIWQATRLVQSYQTASMPLPDPKSKRR